MDFSKIIAALEKGMSFAEGLLPLLGPAGVAASTVINAVSAVTDVVQNVKTRMDEGTIVIASTDQAQLQDILARIQKVNDELAKAIDDS